MINHIYHHRQFSRLIAGSLLASTVVALIVLPFVVAGPPIAWVLGLGAFTLVAALHWVLSSLTIAVTERELIWHFAGGIWTKHLPRSEILRTERVSLPWWYGAGIKYVPGGWVYLVSPGSGVKLTLVSGRMVCIGTDDPDGLLSALTSTAGRNR
jgi:hypothetical protein